MAVSGGLRLEVWFRQQDEASVFLESACVAPEEEQFAETALFGLYAARQVVNLGKSDPSLGLVLMATDTSSPLPQAVERLAVKVVSPAARSGRKGFTAEFRPDKRAFFKLNQHGFGMLARGVGYYAPTSTLALLYWLLNRRRDDATYQRALAATAENIGIAAVRGDLSLGSQAAIAMAAAAAGWEEARDAAALIPGSSQELLDEAYEVVKSFDEVFGGRKPSSSSEQATVRHACDLLERAIAIDVTEWRGQWLLGFARRALDDHEAAYEAFRGAYELEKGNDSPGRELCRECLALGRDEEAIVVAQQLVVRHPEDPGLKANLGLALFAGGRVDDGVGWVSDAYALDPNDETTQRLYDVVKRVREGHTREAEDLAQRYVAHVRARPSPPAWKGWPPRVVTIRDPLGRIPGAVEWHPDGRFTQHVAQAADSATLQAIQGLIALRMCSDPERRVAERLFGVRANEWTVEDEERFGRTFAVWATEGKVPTPDLQRAFEQLRSAPDLSSLRTDDIRLTDDMREFFARLFRHAPL